MTNAKRPPLRGKEKNIKTLISGPNGMVPVIILVLLLGVVVSFAYWGSIPIGGLSGMMRRCYYG